MKIPFNKPFTIGAELENIAAAVKEGHLAGDGRFTRQCHEWLERTLGYRAAELRGKVTEAGFEIVRMTSFVTLLLPLMAASRLTQQKARGGYDPLAELRIAPALNWVLEKAPGAERALIRAGLSLPAGGSLLVVARRATTGNG